MKPIRYGILVFIIFVLTLSATLSFASELNVYAGKWRAGSKLQADLIRVDTWGRLEGDGEIDGDGFIQGRIAPGNGQTNSIGALAFSGDLTFGTHAVFECDTASSTSLDQLIAGGSVTGTIPVTVLMYRASGAIPLHQVIIDGDASSDYYPFEVFMPETWQLSEQAVGDLTISHRLGDSDGDYMTDLWEYDNFGGRTNATDSADGDSDGMNNHDEFFAGTEATNDESALIAYAKAYPSSETNLVVQWDSVSNKQYTLWRSTNLVLGAFAVVESNIVAVVPQNSYTDSVPEVVQYLYRVEVETD